MNSCVLRNSPQKKEKATKIIASIFLCFTFLDLLLILYPTSSLKGQKQTSHTVFVLSDSTQGGIFRYHTYTFLNGKMSHLIVADCVADISVRD